MISLSECLTSYYNNYYVHEKKQHYYNKVLNITQVSWHHFVETCVVQIWASDMNVAWYVNIMQCCPQSFDLQTLITGSQQPIVLRHICLYFHVKITYLAIGNTRHLLIVNMSQMQLSPYHYLKIISHAMQPSLFHMKVTNQTDSQQQ